MEFDEDDEDNKDFSKNNKKDKKSNYDSKSSNKIKEFVRMKTKNLSSFPELISMKENPQTDKIEEKKI